MNQLTTVILAAGHGKRMKSSLAKVLHKVSGVELVNHVIDIATAINSSEIVTVVGHDKEQVIDAISSRNVKIVEQNEILGTGHAVMMADAYINEGSVLVLCGDAPLISEETLNGLIDFHETNGFKASLISAHMADPTGYGRIVRDEAGHFIKIVEHKDASESQRLITEINSGICIFEASLLKEALGKLSNNNEQGEYYLTDVFEYLQNNNEGIGAFVTADADELMGINNRYQLSIADAYYQRRLKKQLMLDGITMINPDSIYIEKNVTIGQDTTIYQGSILKGNTSIGSRCDIGPNADISNCKIADDVAVKHSTLTESSVDAHTAIGPYAYLRPKSIIGKHVKVGDFVEVKNATIKDHSKVSHLSYIGDGVVGENVNVGCGVVFVNYDGKNKFQTVIEDNAFIGCNSNLVAPVTVGKGAYVAAGSTITEDVPEENLAIARQRQVNKTNWSSKYQKKV